jgi:hypothetical protein
MKLYKLDINGKGEHFRCVLDCRNLNEAIKQIVRSGYGYSVEVVDVPDDIAKAMLRPRYSERTEVDRRNV